MHVLVTDPAENLPGPVAGGCGCAVVHCDRASREITDFSTELTEFSRPLNTQLPTSLRPMTKKSNTQRPTNRRRVEQISKADLAERAGVSRAAVTQAAKGCLKGAALEDGSMDATHPATIEYIRLHTKPKHKPRWIPLKQLQAELNLSDAEMFKLLATLPADALQIPERK